MRLNIANFKRLLKPPFYPRSRISQRLSRTADKMCFQIDLSDFARMIPAALDNVKTSLPTDFPENVVTAVETNVLRLHGRLSREYGIK